MRITNGIMINNNLSNINENKLRMDEILTSIETTKKIQRPSDDPITAVRALRLRSTLNEITQYKDRNVEDAESWMTATKDSMDKINEALEDILVYCNQGVNTYQTIDEYNAIVSSLKQFRNEVYATGNADYGDRTLFTGYKTDSTLMFTKDNPDLSYDITEKRTFSDIRNVERTIGVSRNDAYSSDYANAPDYVTGSITNETYHILKLGYDDVDQTAITIQVNGQPLAGVTINTVSKEQAEASGQSVYKSVDPNEVRLIPETGEVVFGENVYKMLNDTDFSITYTKTGFKENELQPEHYFDCVKRETIAGQIKTTTYTEKDQDINYVVSFNQYLTVNVQGKDILQHGIGRDVDEMINRTEDIISALDKINKLTSELELATDDTAKAKITSMKEAAELELAYAQENLKNSFADGIALFKEHQQTVTVELTDLGARMSRLSMIKDRLEQQYLTVDELKSKNEDTNLATAAVEYNAMEDVYDASLSTTAKIVQKSLLNFL